MGYGGEVTIKSTLSKERSFICLESANIDLRLKLKRLPAKDYELAFIEKGQGIPLVLIHGSLSDYRSWALQVDCFSKHFRTIALSLRHCYPQPWESKGKNSVIRQQADEISVFVKKLQAGPVHLVGHSRGGALALLLAAGHPELFHSLVLVDPAPFDTILPDSKTVIDELEKRKAFIIEAVDHIKKGDLDRGLELFTDAVSVPGTWKNLPQAGKQIRRENAWSLKTLLTDAQEPFTFRDVRNIDMPVLLVTAEKSPGLYGMMHAALEQRLKNFKKTRISNASHGMHRDNPEPFNAAVIDFLISHTANCSKINTAVE